MTTDSRTLGRELIDRFGEGWSRGHLDTMVSVFVPDAVFLETPFSSPIRGVEAIRQYWSDVPVHQSEIVFTSGEIYAAGSWISTEFKCTYRRRRTGESVDARGAIFAELEEGRIRELRMYWHRWTGGREIGRS